LLSFFVIIHWNINTWLFLFCDRLFKLKQSTDLRVLLFFGYACLHANNWLFTLVMCENTKPIDNIWLFLFRDYPFKLKKHQLIYFFCSLWLCVFLRYQLIVNFFLFYDPILKKKTINRFLTFCFFIIILYVSIELDSNRIIQRINERMRQT
jgi:hypothetical protein